MSAKNNVNKDYYVTGGRDRQGEDIAARPRPRAGRPAPSRPRGTSSFIPGAPSAGGTRAPVRGGSGKSKGSR
jgi:hypothetical protein